MFNFKVIYFNVFVKTKSRDYSEWRESRNQKLEIRNQKLEGRIKNKRMKNDEQVNGKL